MLFKLEIPFLTTLLATSFLYRLFIILNSQLTFFSDDAIYAELAKFMAKGNWEIGLHPTWQPLFSFLSSIANLFIKNWENSLRIVSALAGTLMLIPLYIFSKKTLSSKHGLIYTTLAAFSAPLIDNSILPMSDSLSSTLIISSIVTLFFALKSNAYKYYFFGFVLLALAFLARSEGYLFFLLSLLFTTSHYLLKVISQKILFSRNSLALPILLIFTFFLTISPYLIPMYKRLGTMPMTAKFSAQIQQGHSFSFRNNSTWSQEIVSIKSPHYQSKYFKGGVDFILQHSNYFWELFKQKSLSWSSLFTAYFTKLGSVIVVIGAFYFIARERLEGIYLISLILIVVPITIFSTPVRDVRYLLWTIPFFLYFFYLGVNVIAKTLGLHKQKVKYLLPVIASLALPLIDIKYLSNPKEAAQAFTRIHFNPQILEVSNWITNNSQNSQPVLMARHEAFEFYTNGETIYWPQAPLEESLEYAKEKRVDFLIAWDREIVVDNNLSGLLNNEFKHKDLETSYTSNTPHGKIIVYRFLK